MINAKLQNIIDTKSAIGNAINNKGGSITVDTPFYEYAPAIENISTGGGAYSTFVAKSQTNALYTVYNGYDSVTNPTPNLSNNFAFNRWLLNNSATGDVVLSNVVVAVGGNFNGPNVTFNEANMPFLSNTNTTERTRSVITNNSFLYSAGEINRTVEKFHESNLVRVGNTAGYGGDIIALATNNGFIYAGGLTNQTVQKFHESNLVRVGNTISYGGGIQTIGINNGFIYVAGGTEQTVKKYFESNLAFNLTSPFSYSGQINELKINNGFVYIVGSGGAGQSNVVKLHESNLVQSAQSNTYSVTIQSVAINNGFVFYGGGNGGTGRNVVTKVFEGNLALSVNSPSYGNLGTGATILSISIANGFVYVGGTVNQTIQKFYESNLAFVGNTANYGSQINRVTTNNGFVYAAGFPDVKKYEQKQTSREQLSFFNITTIKE